MTSDTPGGVDNTSQACVAAVNLVEQGSLVPLVSTDPVSNFGHVFETTLSNEVRAINKVTGGWVPIE